MDAEDWKKKVGFPINYNSGQSSEDELTDSQDVVVRHPRQTAYLLADGGDGAEADLLGTTPPRSRIRDKEKRRTIIDSGVSVNRSLKDSRRNTTDNFWLPDTISPAVPERLKRRATLKLIRSKERDWKQDGSEPRSDSLPSPNPIARVPTLVESCSRFMSLSSKLKCRMEEGEDDGKEACEEVEQDVVLRADLPPPSRLTFHQTFSMLINMGNMEKGCRRTISREEQVWQNELKDLIWLELQAKIAGRTLSQQDSYLCTQRNVVPTVIQKIIDYRFVNPNPCKGRNRLYVEAASNHDLTANERKDCKSGDELEDGMDGCMSINCVACVEAIGSAMREVGSLLDSFYSAVSLYPSSNAMTAEHPLIATQLFKNRLKAMCLWYNIALHMRLQLLAVRRMLITMQLKSKRREQHASYDSDTSRQSSDSNRNTKVQFNVNSPSESSNSEYSSQSEGNKDDIAARCSDTEHREEGSEVESDRSGSKGKDDVDSGVDKSYDEIPTTPEILIDDLTADVSLPDDSYLCNLSVSLRDVTQLRLLNTCQVSPYRNYHFEVLKTQGVRRCMMFINKTRKEILDKVLVTFQKVDNVEDSSTIEEDRAEVFHDAKDEEKNEDSGREESQDHYELRRYGAWSPEGRSMCLPSYRAHFLLLTSICLEAVHDYLTMRLETQPDQPSCLTVKQLIHELKEGLDIASEMRLSFVRDVRAAGGGDISRGGDLDTVIKTFDSTVSDVVEQYHRYLCLMSLTERLGRSCLEAEWAFAARIARRVAIAAKLTPKAFTTVACNQLDLLLSRFKEKFQNLVDSRMKDEPENKHEVYALCRETQSIYVSDKDAILHTVQWSRALATRLARSTRTDYCLLRRDIVNHVMAIRDYIVCQTELVLDQSRIPPDDETARELMDGVAARVRELILQVFRVGFDLHKELYKFAQVPLAQDEVARRRPVSLQPSTQRPTTIDRRRRPETMILNESVNPILMHRELYRFPNEPLARVKRPVRRQRLLRNESINEDCETNVFDDRLFENGDQTTSVLDAIPGAAHTAASACGEDECARTVALAIVQFARCWMTFVMERCDRGRGLRPRWANQGLEFLMLACDPQNTKHLSDEEFEELKHLMDGCISHVIGSRRPTPRAAESPPGATTHRHRLHSPMSNHSTREHSASRDVPTPPTPPPTDNDPLNTYRPQTTLAHSARVLEATRRLDRERDEKLREMKTVGKVNVAAVESYKPKLRQLTFKWQRGLKIGAGTFGKVYTVVNTESGQLLAMKELSFGAGDRRALQRAANELRVLEGVIHAHLVRYYGCEVHREKLLLFMELCVEGSLEGALGAGALDEPAARRYTRQLVAAVTELHARHIVHRDIKSGNIFLTNGGHCLKLGDFGCAVKIRANTTAAGELQGYVGTQAYMAPEVFMKSTGHGRAADIWSLGCVVTEMASGKRPFSEYDSNYQIMFVVGMGGRPEIPSTLSAEGQQFCSICLTHEPEARPKAEDLSMHHFLMLKADDDCNCEPSFLI